STTAHPILLVPKSNPKIFAIIIFFEYILSLIIKVSMYKIVHHYFKGFSCFFKPIFFVSLGSENFILIFNLITIRLYAVGENL
ncbi:MAG: hypothetical protein COS19_09490, partial [Flavobacteriaceae bacterium CG02_land_8_20_14_3_00_34_13]